MRSARIDELPWAMLANGPAWTNAAWPSSVCMSVGCSVSFMRTVTAPATPRSSRVIGRPSFERPMTTRPQRSRRLRSAEM